MVLRAYHNSEAHPEQDGPGPRVYELSVGKQPTIGASLPCEEFIKAALKERI